MPALALLSVLLIGALDAAPAQVVKVVPADGSAPARVEVVGAELNFTRGSPSDLTSLQLLVDGVDVTSRSTIRMSRDWPPSAVSISYAPMRLKPGLHNAEARFRTVEGRMLSYAWSFTVRP